MSATTSLPKGYGQYCPLALTAELLCRRWTILIVSRLFDGCTTFNEIHAGVPRISPSLLSSRLSELEHANVLMRKKHGKRHTYHLTEAGMELEDIIMSMAVWGQHWARDNEMDDLDIGFLAWSMHLRINSEVMPAGRTVMRFEFSGAPPDSRCFWLVSNDGKIDMCMKHPGFDTDLVIQSDLRRFVESWRGIRDLRAEVTAGHIRVTGPKALAQVFPDWLLLSSAAPFKRKRAGREQRIAARNQRKSEVSRRPLPI